MAIGGIGTINYPVEYEIRKTQKWRNKDGLRIYK